MSETRKATLHPEQMGTLLSSLLRAHVGGNRALVRAVDAAYDRVGKITQSVYQLDGIMKYKLPDADAEYEFTHEQLLGFKLALAQAITGVPNQSAPASLATRQHVLLPLAAALGLEKAVRKDAGLADEEAAGKLPELKFDDEPDSK